MAYRKTLSDAQNDIGILKVSGACPTSDDFIARINEAIERAMTMGNWFGTEQLGRFCLYNQCISWPRYVGTVLGVRVCGQSVDIKNGWYSIVGPAFGCGLSGYGDGWWSSYGFRSYPVLRDTGTSPTFADITNESGSYIRIYAVKREDWGKEITLFGTDSNGQPLQEKNDDDEWEMGLTLTLADPYVQSATQVSKIESVLKPVTQGNVLMYEVDPDDATNIKQLALYEPSETRPQYRKSNFSGFCISSSGCKDADDVPIRKIDALVKLEYIPAENENDFLLIDDFVALKFLIQAIRLEEAGETNRASAFELKAVRQLNLRDRDKMPYNQNTVVANPISACLMNPI